MIVSGPGGMEWTNIGERAMLGASTVAMVPVEGRERRAESREQRSESMGREESGK